MSRAVTVDRGWLLLADISGYSAYLANVELEHSADIVADLLGVIADQVTPLFHVAKFEGDALFADTVGEVEADAMFATLEAAYSAFCSRSRTIEIASSCPCRACKGVRGLDLKLILHCGQFARHEVAGSQELIGSEVVLAHRLLKNSVTAETGLRGYAFFTDAAATQLGLDPAAIGMITHDEHYPDLGAVSGHILDLAAWWSENQERHPVFVTPEQATETYAMETSLSPATIWEYTTVASKLSLWLNTDRAEPVNPHGIVGVGSTVHCVKGKVVWENEILDWKPFHYYSARAVDRLFGERIFTQEITPIGDNRWRVEMRFRPVGGTRHRVLLATFGFIQRRELRAAGERFRVLVEKLESASA